MIIIDSSIWIDHFRRTLPGLLELLATGQVLQHPFVTMELALGSIPDRTVTLSAFRRLAPSPVSDLEATRELIERHDLAGTGIGFVDASLLASAAARPGILLWTRDKRLAAQAERLGLAFTP